MTDISDLRVSTFENVGNTCYLNATLHCLFATDYLVSYFNSGDYTTLIVGNIKQTKKDLDTNKIIKKFRKTLSYAFKSLSVVFWGEHCVILPKSFKHRIGKLMPVFNGSDQCDSFELINFILDTLHSELRYPVEIEIPLMRDDDKSLLKEFNLYLKSYLTGNFSPITKMFGGFYLSHIVCDECKVISNKFEFFNALSLCISDIEGENIYDCITEFTKTHSLIDDNKYFCTHCNKKTNATITVSFWKLPSRLIIHLKRFNIRDKKLEKNNSLITFPITNLDMTQYYDPEVKQTCKYNLYGVIQHSGSFSVGHYIAYTKNLLDKKWYRFNDSNVVEIDDDNIEHEVVDNFTYILFYELIATD